MKSLLIVMLLVGFTAPASAGVVDAPTMHAQDAARAEAAPATATVDLNTATAAQLEALPGIGPATAKRILEYREANGPFKKVEDLMNIRGIGEKSFLKLRPQLSVGKASQPAATQP